MGYNTTINGLIEGISEESFDLISRGPDRLTGDPYDDREASVVKGTKTFYPNRDNIANFPLEN